MFLLLLLFLFLLLLLLLLGVIIKDDSVNEKYKTYSVKFENGKTDSKVPLDCIKILKITTTITPETNGYFVFVFVNIVNVVVKVIIIIITFHLLNHLIIIYLMYYC